MMVQLNQVNVMVKVHISTKMGISLKVHGLIIIKMVKESSNIPQQEISTLDNSKILNMMALDTISIKSLASNILVRFFIELIFIIHLFQVFGKTIDGMEMVNYLMAQENLSNAELGEKISSKHQSKRMKLISLLMLHIFTSSNQKSMLLVLLLYLLQNNEIRDD